MASIRPIYDKAGNITAFHIRVFHGRDLNGKEYKPYSKMFHVSPTWSEKTARRRAEDAAAVFEAECKGGFIVDSKMNFQKYCEEVLQHKLKTREIKQSTFDRYKSLTDKIYPHIGSMRLAAITARDLNRLYDRLMDEGMVKIKITPKAKFFTAVDGGILGEKANDNLKKYINKSPRISNIALGKAAGISASTVSQIRNKKSITPEKASAIASALGYKLKDLFQVDETVEEYSTKTIREYHGLISSIFSSALKEGLVTFNVAERASPPKLFSTEASYYEPDMIIKIIELVEKEESLLWKAIALLIIFTGARRAEILGLRHCDLDLKKNRVHFCQNLLYSPNKGKYLDTTKTDGSKRYVGVPSQIMNVVKSYMDFKEAVGFNPNDKWDKENLIFVDYTGEPVHPDSVTDWFSNLAQKYPGENLPHLHPHAFRHSVATALIFERVDLVSVAKTLGHKDATTTAKIYAHAIDAAVDLNAEILQSVYMKK